MAPPISSQKPTDDKSHLPSETTRGIASLLLIIHLICVLVAMSSNLAPSSLQLRLLEVLRPYTQTLNYDFYNTPDQLNDTSEQFNRTPYRITHANGDDVDHRIELLSKGKSEQDSENWIVLPGAGFRGGDRYQRYQRLARNLAELADLEDADLTGSISQAVADSFLHHDQIEIVKLRCRRHMLQSMEDAASRDLQLKNPWHSSWFRDIYLANVIINEGKVMVSNVPLAGRTARPDAGQK